MVIFSHRGIGFGSRENSLEAFTGVVTRGFSVEVDLRMKDKGIISSHDETGGSGFEFSGLLQLIKENPEVFFALHIKEESQKLFQMAANSIRTFKNCFLFVTDFTQDSFIKEMFGSVGGKHLALYVVDKNIDLELRDKVDYFWLDETQQELYKDLGYFNQFHKKLVCCSPELFVKDYQDKLGIFHDIVYKNPDLFGICSDFPAYYIKLINVAE